MSSTPSICDIVHPLSTLPGRNRLRAAASGQFNIPRARTVFSERAFSMAGHASGTLFHKTLQTPQTETLLNEFLRHIILN